MALSKPEPWGAWCGGGGLGPLAQRAAAPLAELASDLSEALRGWAALALAAEETEFCGCCGVKRKEDRTAEACENRDLAKASAVRWPSVALTELAEDLALGKSHMSLYVPAALSVLAGPCPSPAVLCGLSMPAKVVYGFVAALMAMGAWSLWNRLPEERDRTMQRRCAAVLTACSGMHLVMAIMGDVPPAAALYVARPEVAMHFLEDFVMSPLLILNLGHLTGRGPCSMLPCIYWALASTAGAVGAAVAPAGLQSVTFLLLNVSSMGLAAQIISQLPEQAGSISTHNKIRSQISGDLVVFTWTLYPVVQGLGMAGVLPMQQQLHIFALLDVLSKLGACHIMLRSRVALRSAAVHFEAETAYPSLSAPSRVPEPCSEPPPRTEAA